MSHKELRREAETNRKSKMSRLLSDEASDRKMVVSAIRQHEANDHKGEKPTKLKLRRGGVADGDGDGDKGKPRLDRPGRARGGKTDKHKGAHVNVIVAPQMHPPGAAGAAPPGGMPMPPPHPPMMPPPPPGPPPGMPPGAGPGGPPPMGPPGAGAPNMAGAMPHPPLLGGGGMMPRKKGGAVTRDAEGGDDAWSPSEAGADSGSGRLMKTAKYGKNSDDGEGRNRGGRTK